MKPCEIFLGRMQPIHNGHAAIINKMNNPVVVIVRGEKSGNDRKKNPLEFDYQKALLKKVSPQAKVIQSPTGYIPDIIELLRQDNLEPTTVYAGSDRVKSYRAQIERANKTLDKKIEIEFKETERVTSATIVREAIRSDDEEAFKENVPRVIWSEYSTLKKLLKENRMDKLMSFEEFLNEEAGAEANTTAGVEGKEMPLGKDEEDEEEEETEE